MPAQKSWGAHGTMRRYRQGGCNDLHGGEPGTGDRCPECRAAAASSVSRARAGMTQKATNVVELNRKKTIGGVSKTSSKNSRDPSKTSQLATDSVEAGILNDFKDRIEKNQDMTLIRTAIKLARLLDNPDRENLHTQASRQLQAIVDKLTEQKKTKGTKKLALVQAMGGKKQGTGS